MSLTTLKMQALSVQNGEFKNKETGKTTEYQNVYLRLHDGSICSLRNYNIQMLPIKDGDMLDIGLKHYKTSTADMIVPYIIGLSK